MQGLDVIDVSAKDEVERLLRFVYGQGLYEPEQIEDIILFTRRRTEFPNIGTDMINLRSMMYILENIFWMNVCLYVNDDFRACFDDAITIEKALLRVNDQEYEDFRDDMTLEEPDAMPDRGVPIDLMSYSDEFGTAIESRINNAKVAFHSAGMTEVYTDLALSFEPQAKASVSYVIHNLVYVINAFNRNGVFKKYVTLVVDSVKRQLA